MKKTPDVAALIRATLAAKTILAQLGTRREASNGRSARKPYDNADYGEPVFRAHGRNVVAQQPKAEGSVSRRSHALPPRSPTHPGWAKGRGIIVLL
jgi:hypothetical protein